MHLLQSKYIVIPITFQKRGRWSVPILKTSSCSSCEHEQSNLAGKTASQGHWNRQDAFSVNQKQCKILKKMIN